MDSNLLPAAYNAAAHPYELQKHILQTVILYTHPFQKSRITVFQDVFGLFGGIIDLRTVHVHQIPVFQD